MSTPLDDESELFNPRPIQELIENDLESKYESLKSRLKALEEDIQKEHDSLRSKYLENKSQIYILQNLNMVNQMHIASVERNQDHQIKSIDDKLLQTIREIDLQELENDVENLQKVNYYRSLNSLEDSYNPTSIINWFPSKDLHVALPETVGELRIADNIESICVSYGIPMGMCTADNILIFLGFRL